MKAEAVRFLACPACMSGLTLSVQRSEGNEIMQGSLACPSCPAAYPIREGIPRFVADGSYASSFGRQWNWFRTVQLDSFTGTKESETTLHGTTGWQEADYRGRLVLDAGVGAGRFAEIVADKGGEVVGVDITHAVDAAFANIGRRPRVHLIQADLFHLPFRAATVVKDDGALAVYLYGAYGLRLAHACSDLLRAVTTRLPLRLVVWLSAVSVPLYYVYRIPIVGNVLRVFLGISTHPNWRWRWLDTFDWYTPRYQWKFLYPEVVRWFRACGFTDIMLFDDAVRVRGVRPAASRARSDRALLPVASSESGPPRLEVHPWDPRSA